MRYRKPPRRRRDGIRPVPRATGGALAADRTFARLCASLTEEAEAVGWYEQCLAVEPDAEALGSSAEEYPRSVARAVEALRQHGVGGPYGLALGPDEYTRVIETAEHGGYPLFDHLAKILGGPIVWAPGAKGAVVLSLRGGDFLFESGQDLAIGYSHHDAESVHLYLEESFSFLVATPEAAAPLSP